MAQSPSRRGRGAHRRSRARSSTSLARRLFRLVTFVALLIAASIVPILWPHTDPPAPADAVFVLSGDHGERLPIAMSLIDGGLVRTLVFVGTPDRPEEDVLCQTPQRVEFICLRPQPDNTRAEAQAAARLAETRNWRNVVVVTSRYHVTRSQILFRRCFDGRVRVMGGEPPYDREELRRQMSREWFKVAYTVTLERSC